MIEIDPRAETSIDARATRRLTALELADVEVPSAVNGRVVRRRCSCGCSVAKRDSFGSSSGNAASSVVRAVCPWPKRRVSSAPAELRWLPPSSRASSVKSASCRGIAPSANDSEKRPRRRAAGRSHRAGSNGVAARGFGCSGSRQQRARRLRTAAGSLELELSRRVPRRSGRRVVVRHDPRSRGVGSHARGCTAGPSQRFVLGPTLGSRSGARGRRSPRAHVDPVQAVDGIARAERYVDSACRCRRALSATPDQEPRSVWGRAAASCSGACRSRFGRDRAGLSAASGLAAKSASCSRRAV